ncbi:hypothetical protein COLINT_02020 [Collinsella intestinalis DSM 13280]|uniref:Uncharacterized protein n=1 Tax=Collinsella intestinalis DSM 13280 TaxID=521003 RepID=C4F7K5_9ACTN|nr:hypothetical protein COLINT_02020 [Collinsella intestinalis DSM 13280]
MEVCQEIHWLQRIFILLYAIMRRGMVRDARVNRVFKHRRGASDLSALQ